ncbi:peroxiredoxin-like family protein [Microbacterium sp. NPDC076911]|uniref:peroxiredoxin-like family protein n=1 Tax=Microbacterium sp. NPDC076911 TaxID=3154958 RepID=UPI0034127FDD
MSSDHHVTYGAADFDTATLIGRAFPDAALLDVNGAPTTFAQTVAGRSAVVAFYRGAWCPFCNIALREYQSSLVGPLGRTNTALLAISPQKPDGSMTLTEKDELTFDVMSDPGNSIARALGIVAPQSAERTAARLERGLDLTEVNADGTTDLVHPTAIVVDASGVIRWIDVHPDYSTRSAPADILAAVNALP